MIEGEAEEEGGWWRRVGGRAELSRSPGALKKKDLSALTRTRRASYGRDPRTPLLPPPPPPTGKLPSLSIAQTSTARDIPTPCRRGPRQAKLPAWLREKNKLSRTWSLEGRKKREKNNF